MTTPTETTLNTAEIQPRRRVMTHIREAADSTGVPFDYLLAQATQESRLNPEARSRRSSAAGLFQFTAPTWLDMVRKHGAEHGLAKEAAQIERGADGRLNVRDKAAKKAILELRRDPRLSSLMAAEYAKDNAKVLENRLGRTATASDLTLAHFLGAGGAVRVLETMQDSPKSAAAGVLPDAAKANPEMFRSRTVAGLYKAVQARFDLTRAHQPSALAGLHPAPRPELDPPVPTAAPLPTQVAEAPPAAPLAKTAEPESRFFPVAIPGKA